MGLNVFTPGNLVLCWSVMLAELILSFATEESGHGSGLVKANYDSFAGDKPFHILEKHFQSL